jgi:transposase-like protein
MIRYWARKYGKNHLLGKVVRVETPKEVNEVKELRKRMRELEKALADAHIDARLDAAYLKIACRAAGIEDVDDFKKKHAGKL